MFTDENVIAGLDEQIEFKIDEDPEEIEVEPVVEESGDTKDADSETNESATEQPSIAPEISEETASGSETSVDDQEPAPEEVPPAPDAQTEKLMQLLEEVKQEQIKQESLANKMAEDMRGLHKLYHNEYAGRLRTMQEELDQYHEIDRAKVFDDFLKDIAQIYCNNEKLLAMSEDEKVNKAIRYLFQDLAQFMEDHGVIVQKSKPGEKRNRFCQIVERIPTSDESLHDTIAVSRATGFCTDKRAIIKELVDVYTYKKPVEPETPAEEASTASAQE